VEVYRLRCPGELTKDLTPKAKDKDNNIAAFLPSTSQTLSPPGSVKVPALLITPKSSHGKKNIHTGIIGQ